MIRRFEWHHDKLKYRFDHPLRPKGSCYLEAGIIILRIGEPEGEPLDSHVYRTSSTRSIIQGRIKEMAPGGPAPFCGLSNTVFSGLHVQYGIQVFSRFKRPESTRFHLKELQSQKLFSRRSMNPNLPRKVRRSQF